MKNFSDRGEYSSKIFVRLQYVKTEAILLLQCYGLRGDHGNRWLGRTLISEHLDSWC